MQLAKVVGNVIATQKDPNLTGHKLLLVQSIDPHQKSTGPVLVAVDSVGAGVGEEVFVVRGREASFPFLPDQVPTDLNVIGIVDHWALSYDG
ncbi:MAG TPA: ethanolamine utilization protein EutN [Acidobacteria bacterium]|nr:ethanolamine utilization protein EutN [Nitrospirales bacterium]HIA49504.1 ethanolamine utilization protein EutN [Acidobacteriota bacterium]HIN70086.1 ethanolamine utilization protein EutN [Acidobacteriota bacterium]